MALPQGMLLSNIEIDTINLSYPETIYLIINICRVALIVNAIFLSLEVSYPNNLFS